MKKIAKKLIECLLDNNIEFETQFYIGFIRIGIIDELEEYYIVINEDQDIVVVDNDIIGKISDNVDFRDIIVLTIGVDKIDI